MILTFCTFLHENLVMNIYTYGHSSSSAGSRRVSVREKMYINYCQSARNSEINLHLKSLPRNGEIKI